jgi:hypothetical protein
MQMALPSRQRRGTTSSSDGTSQCLFFSFFSFFFTTDDNTSAIPLDASFPGARAHRPPIPNDPDTPHARPSRLSAISNPPPQCNGSTPAPVATVSHDFCFVFSSFSTRPPYSHRSPLPAGSRLLPALSSTRLPQSKPLHPRYGSTTRHGGQRARAHARTHALARTSAHALACPHALTCPHARTCTHVLAWHAPTCAFLPKL